MRQKRIHVYPVGFVNDFVTLHQESVNYCPRAKSSQCFYRRRFHWHPANRIYVGPLRGCFCATLAKCYTCVPTHVTGTWRSSEAKITTIWHFTKKFANLFLTHSPQHSQQFKQLPCLLLRPSVYIPVIILFVLKWVLFS